jgi:galactokinase
MAQANLQTAGADLAIVGDIPVGAGLSSSAALELAALHALSACAGIDWHPTRMAHLARTAENDFVGVACGVMDQFASALGVEGGALLRRLPMAQMEDRAAPGDRTVVVLDTGRATSVDGDGLQRSPRRVRTSRDLPYARVTPDVRSLRDVDKDDARQRERSHGPRGLSTGASCRVRDAAARGGWRRRSARETSHTPAG